MLCLTFKRCRKRVLAPVSHFHKVKSYSDIFSVKQWSGKFKIQNAEFNACICHQSTLQSTAVPPLMSVPPISHSGRCNYFCRDRAKCHQDFLKAIALRHVLLPFFSPSVLAGSFYQLILLTDCPQQFHYRQLACRGEARSHCRGAAGEQYTGARIPAELRTFTSAHGDVCEAFKGR